MADIKSRLSIDFLTRQSKSEESPAKSPGGFMDDAVLAYAGRLLDVLRQSGGQPVEVYNLVDATGVAIDVASRVLDFLAERKLVEFISRDPKRLNHVVRATPTAMQMPA